MLKAKIKAKGKTLADLLEAIEEGTRRIEKDYLTGSDRNESGSFSFEVEGESEKSDED